MRTVLVRTCHSPWRRVLGSTNVTILAPLTDLLRRNYATVDECATEEGQGPPVGRQASSTAHRRGGVGEHCRRKRRQSWDLKERWRRPSERGGAWGEERATATD